MKKVLILMLLCLVWHIENFGSFFTTGEHEAIARANELSCRVDVKSVQILPQTRGDTGDLRYIVIWSELK
jgi:hypothetical protein